MTSARKWPLSKKHSFHQHPSSETRPGGQEEKRPQRSEQQVCPRPQQRPARRKKKSHCSSSMCGIVLGTDEVAKAFGHSQACHLSELQRATA